MGLQGRLALADAHIADADPCSQHMALLIVVNIVTDRDTGQARSFGFVEMINDAEARQGNRCFEMAPSLMAEH